MVSSISVSRINSPICARAPDAHRHAASASATAPMIGRRLIGDRLTGSEFGPLRRWRQCVSLIAALVVLSQCGGTPPPICTVGNISCFTGLVVADDPLVGLI